MELEKDQFSTKTADDFVHIYKITLKGLQREYRL